MVLYTNSSLISGLFLQLVFYRIMHDKPHFVP